MERATLKKRLLYWFDNRMSRGSLGILNILVVFTILAVLLLSGVIIIFGFGRDAELSNGQVMWESFSTIVNAWMPSAEDGGGNLGYVIVMALAAIMGLLLTSILIGTVTSTIEEKVQNLRKGNSEVLEEDHVVVLGFYPGEYTLIKQLILAASDKPEVIVIGGEMEKDEMEDHLRENLEIPKNIKLVCRRVDLFDPSELEKLAIDSARVVIISPTDDNRVTKMLLAVSNIITSSENTKARVSAILSSDQYRFPKSIAEKHNVTTLQTNDTLAKIIAHSCTQTGLSEVIREIFNFEGSELYDIQIPEAAGMTFEELSLNIDGAVPAGILRNGQAVLNPVSDTVLSEDEQILVFAEDRDSYKLLKERTVLPEIHVAEKDYYEEKDSVLIIGGSSSLEMIISELPENVENIMVAGIQNEKYYSVIRYLDQISPDINITVNKDDLSNDRNLAHLLKDVSHVVVLSDRDKNEEDADMEGLFRLLHLRDIRTNYGLDFNITVEMRREYNQRLAGDEDSTDFVVASNMSSLFLAQLAESPSLYQVFSELLSNEGCEIYMKNADTMNCIGRKSAAELRQIALVQHYIFLGYRKREEGRSVFNPPLSDIVDLTDEDSVIVIGEY